MIDIAVAHDGPADARELIGDADHDDIAVGTAIGHLVDPCAHPVLAAVHVEIATSCAPDNHGLR